MSFLEKNRSVLQKHYSGLWEDISLGGDFFSAQENIKDLKIETAPSGDPSLCIKGIHVHSPRDPVREGQRIAEAVSAESGPVVVLGFGLGYAAEAAASLGRPVVIVEKHKALFLKALEARDLSGFFSAGKLIFVIGDSGEGIASALSIAGDLVSDKQFAKQLSFIRNKALIGLDEQWYKLLEDRIRAFSMREDVNTATHKRFGKRWVSNLSRNINAIRDFPGVSRLSGLAAGYNGEPLPVFLAAAGPSLDKIKPMLRHIYERCIVVAVDTNLRFFIQNGIQPDFVLVVDPQFWNSRHLDRCNAQTAPQTSVPQTALVAESAVYPSVLNLPFKNKFLCSSMFPLGAFIEKQVDSKGKLGAGGSVATTAWDFARSLGGKEIWIAGLDLAFPGLKTHFRGARFEEKANSESSRFNPVEKWIVRALRDGFPFLSQSADGSNVVTDRRLSLYRAWFEAQFRQSAQLQNFCFFNDGLAIAGLDSKSTDEFLALPVRRAEIDSLIQSLFSKIEHDFNAPQEFNERHKRFNEAVSVLDRGLKNIKSAAEEGTAIIQKAQKCSLNQQQKDSLLKDLDKIMRRISDSEVKEVAGFLFPDTQNEEAEAETEIKTIDPFSTYLKTSLKLFVSLTETAGFNLKKLHRK
ncbi:MAG: DUF115 domain-containing protein [Treponema sp.]|nr:DUF115 domain-containing protein [Treponema sp.]